MCGLAPSRILSALKYVAGGWEHATIRVLPTGKVEVVTGTSPHGQGHVTAWSQIAADALGVDLDDIKVIHGDTATSPYGMDTYGSRSLVVGGMAIVRGRRAGGREGAGSIAAHMLEADPGRPGVQGRRVQGQGHPGLGEDDPGGRVRGVHRRTTCPTASSRPCRPTRPSTRRRSRFPHGTHLCAVEVDTETGMTKIRKYVCVDDIGKVINPMIVEGQVHGGIAQGIAQALYEEAVYDDDGNLVTGVLVDYLVPAAPDLPHFDDRPHRDAVDHEPVGRQGSRRGRHHRLDARRWSTRSSTRSRQFGVDDVRMACTPERVWRAIHESGSTGGDRAAAGTVAYGGAATETTAGGAS